MIETAPEPGAPKLRAPGLDFETGDCTKLNLSNSYGRNVKSTSISVLRTVTELRAWSRDARRPVSLPDDAGCGTVSWAGPPGTVALVPTMGALHAGHASLIRAAAAACDRVAVSIFVNPTQFAPHEDFSRYPRTFAADCELAQAAGADVIFAPRVEEIYPTGAATFVEVEGLSDRLDGKSRPGHFRGVATVVAKLFIAAEPDQAFFGQKDAAQVAVLRRMTTDLRLGIEIVVCPIVREPDGLALSSRNIYLSAEERDWALTLSRAVRHAEAMYAAGERRAIKILQAVHTTFTEMPQIHIDYVALVDWETLKPVEIAAPGSLFAVAAWVGATRLIDNTVLGETA